MIKIPNSKDNSERKTPEQMAKFKAQTPSGNLKKEYIIFIIKDMHYSKTYTAVYFRITEFTMSLVLMQ